VSWFEFATSSNRDPTAFLHLGADGSKPGELELIQVTTFQPSAGTCQFPARDELPGVQAERSESGPEQPSARIPKITVQERCKWQPLFFCTSKTRHWAAASQPCFPGTPWARRQSHGASKE